MAGWTERVVLTESQKLRAGRLASQRGVSHLATVAGQSVPSLRGAQARSLPGSLHAQKADGSTPVSLTLRARHSPLSSQDKDRVGVWGCSEVGPVSLEPVTREEACVLHALSLARQLGHEVWCGDTALARGRTAGEGGIL